MCHALSADALDSLVSMDTHKPVDVKSTCKQTMVQAIRSGAPYDQLKPLLRECGNNVYGEDFQHIHLDLMQHAIIANNSEAVILLFSTSYFEQSHYPKCNSYLHLACKLGHDKIVGIILQNRPRDHETSAKVCFPNPCYHTSNGQELPTGITPSVICTSFHNPKCLELLLIHKRGMMSERVAAMHGILSVACSYAMVKPLQLLLDSFSYGVEEHYKGFVWCLRRRSHECLHLLLSVKNPIDPTYTCKRLGCHPLHTLYVDTIGYNQHSARMNGILKTTQTLLSHGFGLDVLEGVSPPATYPLYSLVHLVLSDFKSYPEEYVDAKFLHELLPCVSQLLKYGSNSNLNEHELEGQERCGRPSFLSALDVVMEAFPDGVLSGKEFLCSEIVWELSNILLGHCTPPERLYGSTVKLLQCYLSLLASCRTSPSASKHILTVLKKLICLGIDVNTMLGVKCSTVTYYVMEFVKHAKPEVPQTLVELPVIKWLMHSMNHTTLHATVTNNQTFLADQSEEKLAITSKVVNFLANVPMKRLQSIAALTIWTSINRDPVSLTDLPLPSFLKRSLVDIVLKG